MTEDTTAQAVGMDCLTFCIRGMNQQLVDFASTDDGEKMLSAIRLISPTVPGRMREFLLFYNSVFLAQAMTETMGLKMTPHTAWTIMNAPAFGIFQKELCDTIYENFDMLMSKLTSGQRKKLEALVA